MAIFDLEDGLGELGAGFRLEVEDAQEKAPEGDKVEGALVDYHDLGE